MIDLSLKIPMDVLAPAVQEVADFCGIETAFLLVEHFGGCRFYVPTKWHGKHELNIIGEEQAKMLIARLGGGELSIPKLPFSTWGLRKMVKMLLSSGLKQRDIARKLNITMKTVRNISSDRCPQIKIKGKVAFLKNPDQLDLEDYLNKTDIDGQRARDAIFIKRK